MSVEQRLSKFIILLGPLVTLVVTPWFNYDPINLGKCLVLSTLAFGGLGLVVPYFSEMRIRLGSPLFFSITVFMVALLAPLILTEAPIQQQLWGQFGRTTGVVTYASLLCVFVISSLINSTNHYRSITKSLVATQILMTAYCVMQAIHKDPIRWSSYSTFGTLGNVNFLSGFMGIAVVVSLILSTNKSLSPIYRLALVILSLIDVIIVATTDSIQGLVALGVGFAVFLAVVAKRLGRGFFVSYSVLFVLGFVSLVFALFDKGPLRTLIYQVTIIFRADYMQAGVKMLLHHPLTGVGIDSYDDWYRGERGIISAFRTSFNRTANTAHNIMLDIGSGGGFPLLLAYLALLFFVVLHIYRGFKSGLQNDSVFLALACAWIAYQVQAAVSINQIGVGVWGWLIGGSIIGYEKSLAFVQRQNSKGRIERQSFEVKKLKKKNSKPNTPPAIAVVASFTGMFLGFTATIIPLKIDMDFRSAFYTGKLDKIMAVTENKLINSFLLARANEIAIKSPYQQQARILNDQLTQRYPRYIYGWQARLNLSDISEGERIATIGKIRSLDPYLAICADPSPSDKILELLSGLPSEKQYELAKGWSLVQNPSRKGPSSFNLRSIDSNALSTKIKDFCQG